MERGHTFWVLGWEAIGGLGEVVTDRYGQVVLPDFISGCGELRAQEKVQNRKQDTYQLYSQLHRVAHRIL